MEVDLTSATLVLDTDDIYTLANCNLLIDADPSTTPLTAVAHLRSGGEKILGDEFGGSSVPLLVVQPSYYPKAMSGAECGAHLTSIDWANLNLHKGYQYVKTARGVFVSGVLNSTQTESNDPFDSADIIAVTQGGEPQAACWKEAYAVTYNPF